MRWAAITRPESAVWGGALAAKEYGEEVLLVGKPEVVANVLKEKGLSDVKGITIMPANDLVDMHDDPATVLRHKPDSSMAVAFKLLKAGGGRRAGFRGQHRRTAHRRNAVRRPHQGHPTRCTGTGYAVRERSGHAVRCGCKHRMHRRNAAPVRVPRFAVCGEDKRCRQAACRPCQQRHGGYQG